VSANANGLVAKLWNYCNVLRDDGLSYGDYLEQLTFLLFLKMADELTKPPFNGEQFIPDGFDWQSLLERDGEELEAHYIHVLRELGQKPGMLGVVFRKAQNRIQDWIYDFRTNQHFTLKQNPLRREHLDEFVASYKPGALSEREETERFKRFTYDELLQRDKVSLDITWLRDDSLEDIDNLPPPEIIAQEIVEDLEAALSEFAAIATSLRATSE